MGNLNHMINLSHPIDIAEHCTHKCEIAEMHIAITLASKKKSKQKLENILNLIKVQCSKHFEIKLKGTC